MKSPTATAGYYWLGVPVAMLMLVPVVASSISPVSIEITEAFSASAYWQAQVPLFSYLNQSFAQSSALFWFNATLLGDAAVLLPLAWLAIYRCPQVGGALIATLPIGTLFSSVGKQVFNVPRPAAVLDNEVINIIGPVLTGHTSLPSGHSLTYVAIGIAVLATWKPVWLTGRDKLIGLSLVLLLAGLCFSRVVVAAHWPLDLLVGGSLGAIAGYLGAIIAAKHQTWWRSLVLGKGRWFLMLGFLIWFVALYMRLDKEMMTPVVMYIAMLACLLVVWCLYKQPSLRTQSARNARGAGSGA